METKILATYVAQRNLPNGDVENTGREEDFDVTARLLAMPAAELRQLEDDQEDSDALVDLAPAWARNRSKRQPYAVRVQRALNDFLAARGLWLGSVTDLELGALRVQHAEPAQRTRTYLLPLQGEDAPNVLVALTLDPEAQLNLRSARKLVRKHELNGVRVNPEHFPDLAVRVNPEPAEGDTPEERAFLARAAAYGTEITEAWQLALLRPCQTDDEDEDEDLPVLEHVVVTAQNVWLAYGYEATSGQPEFITRVVALDEVLPKKTKK